MFSDLLAIVSLLLWVIAFFALMSIRGNTSRMEQHLALQNFLLKLRLKQIDPTLQLPGDKAK